VFDTTIVIVGNVLTAPEWRKTSNTGHLVANFRVASTSRRLDQKTGRWVDGNSLRVRVVCWRKLAEGVAASLTVGDPVVVTGKLYTRDWTDNDNNPRTSYEMEAVSVGHDLARGRDRFYRNRPAATSGVEAEGQVRGETADLVPDDEIPAGYGDGVPDEGMPTFDDTPSSAPPEPATALPGGGFEPFDKEAPTDEPTPGDSPEDELEMAVEAIAEDSPRRSRRTSRRQPVAA
jgi:single-strand DNA-binding protein